MYVQDRGGLSRDDVVKKLSLYQEPLRALNTPIPEIVESQRPLERDGWLEVSESRGAMAQTNDEMLA